MLAPLPKWVTTDNFEIQAKAEGNPTKDQMRLMMQSLLADRFKLAVHFEDRPVPAYNLAAVKPKLVKADGTWHRHIQRVVCAVSHFHKFHAQSCQPQNALCIGLTLLLNQLAALV